MAITDLKLKDSDIAAKGVAAAPTVLNGTPEENKRVFDRLVREVLKGDFNGLIDALTAATGAGEIGAAVEGLTGATVQAILNAIKAALDAKASDAATSAALEGKADKLTISSHIKEVELDSSTGVFTFTRQNGTKITIDTALEKVAVNFAYDKASQSLKLTLADGSTETVPLSDFITVTEFEDSDTLEWSVSADGSKAKATIKAGSITDTMLSSALKGLLAGYVNKAAQAATAAAGSESSALSYKNAAEAAARDAASSKKTVGDYATAAQQAADDAEGNATAARQSAESADAAAAEAQQMEARAWDSAEDAEAWAVGRRNGVDVGADDPAYQKSAKYWAEQAAGGGAGGGNVTDEQVSSAVSTWLTAHPEATTTVQDGSVTDAKLSDDLYKQVTGGERHKLTEVAVPLIEYQYNSWVMAAGTNNGIAPIKTPQKFRITNPSATAEVGLLMRFLDGEDPETATISDNQVAREGFYWRVPAGETVEFETLEYGRITTKYIQIRWSNWPRVLLDITAIYDSYVPPEPVLDTVSEYLQDFPMRWTLQPLNKLITHETAFCCVPFYPDTTYYVYNPDRVGAVADNIPDVYGLPDETFFAENNNKWAPISGGLTENIPVHVYKKVATGENSDSMIKFTTKSWAETMGCKWLVVPCGGQQMRYPITADSTLDQDTIKAWFDGIQAAGSPIAYVSRFNKKIDRHIYSQIVMLNPALPNDEGTMGMAMALQMPSPLAKAKWMLFGDSLTDAYGGHDLTGKYFASKIAREFGMELDNRAMDGSNIYRGGSGNYVSSSGMIKLDELVAEIDAGTTEQPDYITIAFGTNSFAAQIGTNADTSETDTSVYGATKRFIEVLREKCPKSVFGFVLSPKQQWPQSSDPSGLRAIDAARTAIKAVCDDYGVPYIDMSTQSGITVAMLPDGLHISNDQSQNLYYHAMRRFMIGL